MQKKYIHIKKDDRLFIAKAFDVTERMVFKAISFESDTELARKIRRLAYERGGILMVVAPSTDALLHDSDKVTRQYFPNGALLELDRKDGTGTVIFKGEQVKHYEHVTLSQIDSIQSYAAQLS